MSIRTEIQGLAPSSIIELFELDMSVTTSGGKLFFHAGTNNLGTSVVWQGVEYQPWPIKASGFDKTGSGSLPRPKITVSNYGGTISAEVAANDDLVGCTITRRRTLARFLDASNFPSETRPPTLLSTSLMKSGSLSRRRWRLKIASNLSYPVYLI
jgi:lambda family phage minor tail protein L